MHGFKSFPETILQSPQECSSGLILARFDLTVRIPLLSTTLARLWREMLRRIARIRSWVIIPTNRVNRRTKRTDERPITATAHQTRRSNHLVVVAMAAVCLAAGLPGCVHRRMTIRSDPPGALVLLDGEEHGYTPASIDFTYYGTREITLVKPGYETETILQRMKAPWYQRIPFDFFSDNLLPSRITNRHEFSYQLRRSEIPMTKELMGRANALRSEAQVGQ